MSPLVAVLIGLACVYLLDRLAGRFNRAVAAPILTPSRCEHFAPDEEFDSWAATWTAVYAEDELERWASIPYRGDRT